MPGRPKLLLAALILAVALSLNRPASAQMSPEEAAQRLRDREQAATRPAVLVDEIDFLKSTVADQLRQIRAMGEAMARNQQRLASAYLDESMLDIGLTKAPKLNRDIVLFARRRLGQKVGDGQCWTLAAEALDAAHAQRPDVYVFGRRLGPFDAVFPGDIVQFTSAHFVGELDFRMGDPHHTAIIERVVSGPVCELIQQNPGPVNEVVLDFSTLRSGSYDVFRPLPLGPATQPATADRSGQETPNLSKLNAP